MKVVICETFFYLLIISMAIAGNSCVLLAVYRNSRLRTVPNYYIVSLAISDILLPLLCAPYSVAVAIVGHWPFNDSVCQSQGFFVIILACASLLILTLTAINRFFRMVVTLSNLLKIFFFLRSDLKNCNSERGKWITITPPFSYFISDVVIIVCVWHFLFAKVVKLLHKYNNPCQSFA